MATPESKYTVTISFSVSEDGKNEPPMNDSKLVWTGLNYATVCGFEAFMLEVLGKTQQWGVQMAEQLGQGDELKQLLGVKDTKK